MNPFTKPAGKFRYSPYSAALAAREKPFLSVPSQPYSQHGWEDDEEQQAEICGEFCVGIIAKGY